MTSRVKITLKHKKLQKPCASLKRVSLRKIQWRLYTAILGGRRLETSQASRWADCSHYPSAPSTCSLASTLDSSLLLLPLLSISTLFPHPHPLVFIVSAYFVHPLSAFTWAPLLPSNTHQTCTPFSPTSHARNKQKTEGWCYT